MTVFPGLRARSIATGLHLAASLVIAAGVAVLTMMIWYPGPVGRMAGGDRLFLLVLGVDVVMGPLLTLAIFDVRKPRVELVRDLSVIAALQLGALAYGLHVVHVARPVALVYEPGRFRLVTANEVRVDELPLAREEYRALPLAGPLLLGTRAAQSSNERLESIDLALKGFDIGQRPSFWQPYAESQAMALSQSRPVAELLARYPQRRAELHSTLRDLGLEHSNARFLPVVARDDWVAILNARGDITGFAAFDGF